MLNIKRSKSNLAFSVEASHLSNVLDRINSITSFGATAEGSTLHLFVAQEKRLFLIGMSQDVMAYICVNADIKTSGVCLFQADLMLGLSKKKKGTFSFEVKGSEFNFKNGTFKGKLHLSEITDEMIEAVNDIAPSKNSVTLKSDTLDEIKRSIKMAASKDAVFSKDIPVHLSLSDGKLVCLSHDGYHARIFKSNLDLKNKDFQLSVTGQSYKVIEKFVGKESVTFTADSHLRIFKQDAIYASIPSTQSTAYDFEIADHVDKLSKSKSVVSFLVPGSVIETINSMFALDKAAPETNSQFHFELSDDEILIKLTTSVGSVSEVVPIKIQSGKPVKFSVGAAIIDRIFSNFTFAEELPICVYAGRFIIQYDCEHYTLQGLGSFDE